AGPAASRGVSQPGFWLSTSGIGIVGERDLAPALYRLSGPGVQHQHRIQSDRYPGSFAAGQTGHDDPGADLAATSPDHCGAGYQCVVKQNMINFDIIPDGVVRSECLGVFLTPPCSPPLATPGLRIEHFNDQSQALQRSAAPLA